MIPSICTDSSYKYEHHIQALSILSDHHSIECSGLLAIYAPDSCVRGSFLTVLVLREDLVVVLAENGLRKVGGGILLQPEEVFIGGGRAGRVYNMLWACVVISSDRLGGFQARRSIGLRSDIFVGRGRRHWLIEDV